MAYTVRDGRSSSSAALNTLAVVSGLAGYLTLLGGLLLTVRFLHIGVPVSPAVSLISPAQLVATALTELLVYPVVVLAAFGALGLVGRNALDTSASGRREWRDLTRAERAIASSRLDWVFDWRGSTLMIGAVACIAPLNVFGAAYVVTIGIAIFLREPILDRLESDAGPDGEHWRRALTKLAIGAALLAMAPVVARQVVDPTKAETVSVVRPGKPALNGYLITVRQDDVVIARCGRLRIVPIPSGVRIDRKPSDTTTGWSVVKAIGLVDEPDGPAVRC